MKQKKEWQDKERSNGIHRRIKEELKDLDTEPNELEKVDGENGVLKSLKWKRFYEEEKHEEELKTASAGCVKKYIIKNSDERILRSFRIHLLKFEFRI